MSLMEGLTVSQLCRELSVHRRTVEKWIERGKLNAVRAGRWVVVLIDGKFAMFVDTMEKKTRWRTAIRQTLKGKGNLQTLKQFRQRRFKEKIVVGARFKLEHCNLPHEPLTDYSDIIIVSSQRKLPKIREPKW